MSETPKWGVVATIKAPARDIMNFAAHHLDLGAHRIHIYLDALNAEAEAALRAHPKCRVIVCDDDYWRRRRHKGRPDAHQPRQSLNATHCLNRRPQVDWLAHIDVDEFLLPTSPLSAQLAAMSADTLSARARSRPWHLTPLIPRPRGSNGSNLAPAFRDGAARTPMRSIQLSART